MKIEKRIKGILRFKTEIGTVLLNDGINELSEEQFNAIKAHPMFEALSQTSGIRIISEKVIVSEPKKQEEIAIDEIESASEEVDEIDVKIKKKNKNK